MICDITITLIVFPGLLDIVSKYFDMTLGEVGYYFTQTKGYSLGIPLCNTLAVADARP